MVMSFVVVQLNSTKKACSKLIETWPKYFILSSLSSRDIEELVLAVLVCMPFRSVLIGVKYFSLISMTFLAREDWVNQIKLQQ